MSADNRQRSHDIQDLPVNDKQITEVADDYVMGPQDLIVEIAAATGAITITLPNVDEATGKIYSINLRDNGAGTPTVATITAPGPGIIGGNKTIDADGDYLLLYSNGYRWFTLVNGIA